MENNAKCPLCGKDFYIGSDSEEVVCPNCGKEVSAIRAVRFFESFSENAAEKKFAYGEDYHHVNLLLDTIKDLIDGGDYALAEEKIGEALSLTDTDYRVYMAMVAVKTKNYTDLSDETHKPYIDKAISVADVDGKKDIAATYKNYYEKTKLSKEQLERFTEEEADLKKDRVEKSFKSLIPSFMAEEKRNKLFIILFPILMAVGVGIALPFLLLDKYLWISAIGGAFVIAGYVLFHIWFMSKDKVKAFNAILDLYDLLDGADIVPDSQKQIYGMLLKIYLRFDDNDPIIGINREVIKLVGYLLALNREEITEFICSNRYLSENIPDSENE